MNTIHINIIIIVYVVVIVNVTIMIHVVFFLQVARAGRTSRYSLPTSEEQQAE